MRTDTILVPDIPDRCRWCGCTARRPCAGGCTWANARRSLCSGCVEIDAWVRTPAGRRTIARLVQPLTSAGKRTRGRRREEAR